MQNQPSNSLVNLLVCIITHLLRNNLIHSALFFAERLHTLIPSAELATYLLAVCLLKSNDYQATVHLLRNAPVFIPFPSAAAATVTPLNNRKGKHPDPFNDSPCHKKLNPNQRPANLASTRCALVYSKACSMIDRPKEGLEVYLEAIDQYGISSHDQDFLLASTSEQSTSSAYTHLAKLAYNSHEYEKASQFYSKALESTPDGHLCWEAFEGLCQTISTEHDLDPNQIFSVTQLEHFLPGYMELDDQFILYTSSTNPSTMNHTRHPTSGLPIVSNAPIKPKPPPLAPKDAFRIMGANGLYRHKQMLIDTSFGDSSRNSSFAFNSFDLPSYHPKPGQTQPNSNFNSHATPSTPNLNRPSPLPPRSFNFAALGEPPQHASSSAYDPIPISSTPNLRHGFEHNQPSSSSHPPPMPAPSPLPYYPKKSSCDHQSPLPAKGQQARGGLISVKRTRSQTQSQDLSRSSTGPPTTTSTELDSGHSTNTDKNSTANTQPTAIATTTTTTTTAANATQTAKLGGGRLLSRREMLESGRLLKVGPRETKRAKSNSNMMDPDQHPSTPTLPSSDLPPTSYPPQSSSSVPLPSSSSSNSSRFRADKIQAINWVLDLLRVFAAAQLALSRFKSELVLDLLASLPADQQRSWRVYCLIGRARFEMLDYKSAEIAFRKARECFPHLVTHMDIYSTLLWHLRKTTMLSYLSQELQLINSQASETWIATGNLFSRLDDHPNALKCFQRATQLCKTSSYGYTLSGHESLMLAEYSRSLVFFRESIRRNSRSNYNAFFGLGECFFKQDRFRLALFFFNHARKINPYNPLILAAVAKVYQAVGDLQPALQIFSQAVNLAHHCVASVRFSRAKILFELGEFEESKEDLLKLVELVPTEFNVRFLLGKIFAKLGNKQLAIKHLTFAVDLDPKALAVVKKILDHLHHSSLDQQEQAVSDAS